jgi:hypothetical protein
MPILLGRKRTPAEFAEFATQMAALNPSGFRQPGHRGGTSLPEQACIRAGMLKPEDVGVGPSARGERKRKIRRETRRLIREGKTWV